MDLLTENIQNPHQPKSTEVQSPDKRLSELAQLEADVKLLEATIKRKEHDRNSSRAQNIESLLKQNELAAAENTKRSIDIIYAEIEQLEYKLEITQNITGITMTHSECKLTEKGENFLRHLRVIKGKCGEIEFQLELEVLETLKSDTSSDAEIVEMKVNVPEHFYYSLKDTVDRMMKFGEEMHLDEYNTRITKSTSTLRLVTGFMVGFSNQMAEAEEHQVMTIEEMLSAEKSVQGLLKLLEPYQRWCSVRDKTFSHFQEKYPDIVKLHMDTQYQSLIISNPSRNWGSSSDFAHIFSREKEYIPRD